MFLLFPVWIKSTRCRPPELAKLFDGLIEYFHNIVGAIMIANTLFLNTYP